MVLSCACSRQQNQRGWCEHIILGVNGWENLHKESFPASSEHVPWVVNLPATRTLILIANLGHLPGARPQAVSTSHGLSMESPHHSWRWIFNMSLFHRWGNWGSALWLEAAEPVCDPRDSALSWDLWPCHRPPLCPMYPGSLKLYRRVLSGQCSWTLLFR